MEIESRLQSHAVEPAWERAVGRPMALHTRAARLVSGLLTVEARSAAWLQEASLQREQLRAAINAELPGAPVHALRFRLGGGFPPLRPAEAHPAELPSDEAVLEEELLLAADGHATGARIVARARALQRARAPHRK